MGENEYLEMMRLIEKVGVFSPGSAPTPLTTKGKLTRGEGGRAGRLCQLTSPFPKGGDAQLTLTCLSILQLGGFFSPVQRGRIRIDGWMDGNTIGINRKEIWKNKVIRERKRKSG